MAAEIEGVTLREARQVRTGWGNTRKRKAILVDCETVHDRWRAGNSFITPDGWGPTAKNRELSGT